PVWLPAMAGLPAAAGHRGDGCRDPVLGPAHRCVPGPGIPELAEARIRRRRLIRNLAVSLALAAATAGGAAAQPVALPSPSWSDLPAAERQTLAPIAPEWDKLDAPRKQKRADLS